MGLSFPVQAASCWALYQSHACSSPEIPRSLLTCMRPRKRDVSIRNWTNWAELFCGSEEKREIQWPGKTLHLTRSLRLPEMLSFPSGVRHSFVRTWGSCSTSVPLIDFIDLGDESANEAPGQHSNRLRGSLLDSRIQMVRGYILAPLHQSNWGSCSVW